MFKVLLAGALLSVNLYAECERVTVDNGPFLVTSTVAMGNKIYDNFRSLEDSSKKKAYIPMDSIVRDLRPDGLTNSKDGKYMPVEVLQTANLVRESYLKRSRMFFKQLTFWGKDLPRVKEGHHGYIHRESARPSKEYVYVLKDQSLLNLGQNQQDLVVLSPKLKDGKYAAKKCDNGDVIHIFKAEVKSYNTVISESEFEVNMKQGEGQALAQNLVAIQQDAASSLLSIFQYLYLDEDFSMYGPENLEYIHTLKLLKFPLDVETMQGPFSSYYYNPDNSGYDDIFIKRLSACAFISVLRDFHNHYDGKYEVAFGDMFHPLEWKEHKSHKTGLCIDIRPVRNDGKRGGLTYNDSSYSYSATQKLISLSKKAGASSIYFNDPKIINSISGVSYMGGHNNHIHLCFNDTETVRKSCTTITK
jgi:hypothetical protein